MNVLSCAASVGLLPLRASCRSTMDAGHQPANICKHQQSLPSFFPSSSYGYPPYLQTIPTIIPPSSHHHPTQVATASHSTAVRNEGTGCWLHRQRGMPGLHWCLSWFVRHQRLGIPAPAPEPTAGRHHVETWTGGRFLLERMSKKGNLKDPTNQKNSIRITVMNNTSIRPKL